MQEYIGLIKIEEAYSLEPDINHTDPNLRQNMNLYKQITDVQNIINLKINLLLENQLVSNQALESQ